MCKTVYLLTYVYIVSICHLLGTKKLITVLFSVFFKPELSGFLLGQFDLSKAILCAPVNVIHKLW